MVYKIEVGDLVHVELLDGCSHKCDRTSLYEYEYKYTYQDTVTYVFDDGIVIVNNMFFRQDGKNITLVRKANHGGNGNELVDAEKDEGNNMRTLKVTLHLSIGYVNSNLEEVIEITENDCDLDNEEEVEEFVDDCLKDWAHNHIDMSWTLN